MTNSMATCLTWRGMGSVRLYLVHDTSHDENKELYHTRLVATRINKDHAFHCTPGWRCQVCYWCIIEDSLKRQHHHRHMEHKHTKSCRETPRTNTRNGQVQTEHPWTLWNEMEECLWIMDPHSRASKKNTSHRNVVLSKDTMHLIQKPCYQRVSPCKHPAGIWATKPKRAVENREKWRKLTVKSSIVPKLPLRLRDRWWWWWWATPSIPSLQYQGCGLSVLLCKSLRFGRERGSTPCVLYGSGKIINYNGQD